MAWKFASKVEFKHTSRMHRVPFWCKMLQFLKFKTILSSLVGDWVPGGGTWLDKYQRLIRSSRWDAAFGRGGFESLVLLCHKEWKVWGIGKDRNSWVNATKISTDTYWQPSCFVYEQLLVLNSSDWEEIFLVTCPLDFFTPCPCKKN